MAGRPKEFDPAEALEGAMDVFWRQGYEATAVQDLLDAMGINRGSMYDTFGCKHDLFLRAVQHYAEAFETHARETLEQPGSPLANLKALFRGMEKVLYENTECPGCLITNAVMEMAHRDATVAEELQRQFAMREKTFVQLLDRAVDAGEIPAGAPRKRLAAFLVAISHGSVVCAKAGAPRATVRAIADIALLAVARGEE